MSRSSSSHRLLAIIFALLCAALPFIFLIQASANAIEEEEVASDLEVDPWRTIYTDTFDSEFPARWIITDTSGLANGEYFWAATSVRASQGTDSLWATGGGKNGRELVPGSDNYPNDASSIMVVGPITVGQFQELRLSMDVWIDTQPISDTLKLQISSDGAVFSTVQTMSGALNQWQTIRVALDERDTSNRLWLKIFFNSDHSTAGKGVFIDNLKLEAKEEDHLPLLFPVIQGGIEPSPTPSAGWLSYINQFRMASSLEPLAFNQDWSEGASLHSRYMVLNDYVGHYENPENQWYTPAGAAAAKSSNVFVTGWFDSPDENAVSFWMVAPFHAVSILDPQLKETGFGSYREESGHWKMAAALDVVRGLGKLPEGTIFPILYPPDEGQIQLLQYHGGEFPDPLASCPNYAAPTGSPIIIQLGSGDLTPVILSHILESGGQILESCIFDETNYSNANSGQQASGRIILNNRDAVVIMPRYPLERGRSFSVNVTTSDGPISWSFQTINFPGVFNNMGQYDQIVK